MQKFVDTIRRHVIRTNIYEPIEQPASQKVLEEKIKVIQEVSDAFEGAIPAVRAELEKEFRRLLGAEQIATVHPSDN